MQTLACDVVGAGPTLGLVHGFTQTRRSWRTIAGALAADHRVVSVDAPGHGESAGIAVDLWGAGRAVVDTCGDGALVGYSMGGRICLHAALAAPGRVRRLALVGATAGIRDADARADRKRSDDALAARIEAGGDAGVPAFLEEWLAGPLFAHLSEEAADLGSRLQNTAAGLASSLRLCGTATQEPLDDLLPAITPPVLLVVGERDHKFRAEADRLAAGLPAASVAVVPGAGHACHLERPDAFVDILRCWLAE